MEITITFDVPDTLAGLCDMLHISLEEIVKPYLDCMASYEFQRRAAEVYSKSRASKLLQIADIAEINVKDEIETFILDIVKQF